MRKMNSSEGHMLTNEVTFSFNMVCPFMKDRICGCLNSTSVVSIKQCTIGEENTKFPKNTM